MPDRGLVDVAHEGHVELHDLGLERREAREPGISRTEVVDRDPETETPQSEDTSLNILNVVNGRALRDLKDDAFGHLGERSAAVEQIRIEQVSRVQVHEERRVVRRSVERFGT